jgi:hypothetical protein
MNSETLAKKVESELDRWSRDDEKHAERAANILLPRKHDSGSNALKLDQNAHGQGAGSEEMTEDPPFIKAPPIGMGGPWRRAYHYNGWWVTGHQMMHPCRDERHAEKLCARLKEGWEET